MEKLEEMDEHTQESLQQVATSFNVDAKYILEKWEELWQAVGEAVAVVAEQLGDVVAELPEMPRTPVEIKKEIKYEKNPMRLKQLNQELNESYKVYRKRGAGCR